MSLKQIAEKIKPLYTFLWIFLLIVDVYILGILSDKPKREVKVVFDSFIPTYTSDNKDDGRGEVLASKNGSKYYFPDCSGVKRIKEENIVSFSSEEEAIRNGYEKSKTCE